MVGKEGQPGGLSQIKYAINYGGYCGEDYVLSIIPEKLIRDSAYGAVRVQIGQRFCLDIFWQKKGFLRNRETTVYLMEGMTEERKFAGALKLRPGEISSYQVIDKPQDLSLDPQEELQFPPRTHLRDFLWRPCVGVLTLEPDTIQRDRVPQLGQLMRRNRNIELAIPLLEVYKYRRIFSPYRHPHLAIVSSDTYFTEGNINFHPCISDVRGPATVHLASFTTNTTNPPLLQINTVRH